jgi:hypothetical protein
MLRTLNRFLITLIVIAAVIGLTALAAEEAQAQIGVCNPPEGTPGLTRDGRPANCRDGSAAPCSGMMLGEGRVWLHCQPPKPPEPGCLSPGVYQRWGGPSGDMCSSQPPGTPQDPNKHILPSAKPGAVQLIHDGFGTTRGVQEWRCTAGQWRLLNEGCRTLEPPAPASAPKPKPRLGDARVGTR